MKRLLIDGREFVAGRQTGIARVLTGLIEALLGQHPDWQLTVAMEKSCALPLALEGRVNLLYPPHPTELWWPLLARDADLFLSPYPKLPLLPLPCPAIHIVHDVLYLTHPAYRGNRGRVAGATWRLRRALKQSRLTWFDSTASLSECAALGLQAPHAAVRHPAIDSRFVAGTDTPQQPPFFLFVGNGRPHKNLPLLLRALNEVPANLLAVGIADGAPLLAALPESLRAKVRIEAQVDDRQLLWLYRRATALLLPSTAEGYGYPPLEAMACGTPAVVADIAVLRETTGGAAMLATPDDAQAWQQAMRAMLDPAVRAEWAEKGLRHVEGLRAPAGWSPYIADIERLLAARG